MTLQQQDDAAALWVSLSSSVADQNGFLFPMMLLGYCHMTIDFALMLRAGGKGGTVAELARDRPY